MNRSPIEIAYEKSVINKFNVFNSMFLNLPFKQIKKIGMLIPLLSHESRQALAAGKAPLDILETFFEAHTEIYSEEEKIDFMLRVIQYVERQIVLYDSVADAGYCQLLSLGNHMTLKNCIDMAVSRNQTTELIQKISDFSIRIVFTAHPTQFYPRSALDIIARLRALIRENNLDEIDLSLQQLGLTSLMNTEKPTPFDEAKNIIYFLRSVYYDAVGELYANIKKNLPCNNFDNPDIVQLGFWPGGDRDGNPFVTSQTTGQVADELRMTLLKCYYHEIKALEQKLTFKKIEDILAHLRSQLYSSMFDPEKTLPVEKILTPLIQAKKLLEENFNNLYAEKLDSLIDKVKIFRTHFATLDIRQNHNEHKKTIESILIKQNIIKESLDELSKDQLIAILVHEKIAVHEDLFPEEITKDTIKTMKQMRLIQDKNGEPGCNRYIISNSEDIFSVLFVYALLKWCSWDQKYPTVDVVPLFESMEGMINAEAIMQELFEIPEYRAHVQLRKGTQTIMMGFSDGTKDGGYLNANWSILKTKEILSDTCRRYGVKAIFFDGRGGPPARGGGKTHRFYASQSHQVANHAIQLTIQGQTITSLYGTRTHFIHNCEQLLTAGLTHGLSVKPITISPLSRQVLERLGLLSYEIYTALKHHELFLPYLENKSTLKYYSAANIGSRPAKRGEKTKLEFKDLRAISFVGSWSQLRQNVPGYFGIGTALKKLGDEIGLGELQRLYKEVPFFKTLLLNSMMSMSKCYFELTAYTEKDPVYGDFWKILFEEFQLSKQMVLLVSNSRFLMEEELISKRSIKIREDIVLPLLIIQQYAFQKIEKTPHDTQPYENLIQRSLYGNINASRNSA